MNRQARDGMRLDLHAQFGQLAPYLVGVARGANLGEVARDPARGTNDHGGPGLF